MENTRIEMTVSSKSSQIIKAVLIFIGFIVLEFIVLLKMTFAGFMSDATRPSVLAITEVLVVVTIPYLWITTSAFLKQKRVQGITLVVLLLLSIVWYLHSFFFVYVP